MKIKLKNKQPFYLLFSFYLKYLDFDLTLRATCYVLMLVLRASATCYVLVVVVVLCYPINGFVLDFRLHLIGFEPILFRFEGECFTIKLKMRRVKV